MAVHRLYIVQCYLFTEIQILVEREVSPKCQSYSILHEQGARKVMQKKVVIYVYVVT